jgi:hypothetical protein
LLAVCTWPETVTYPTNMSQPSQALADGLEVSMTVVAPR